MLLTQKNEIKRESCNVFEDLCKIKANNTTYLCTIIYKSKKSKNE
jgi:hypothetical protein